MGSSGKIRIDQLLLDKDLVESRTKAKALILAGQVLVNNQVIDKAGTLIDPEAPIRLKGILKYVSRGGLKLEKALEHFDINPKNKTCLDIGLSTGGFSDCLLQKGARKIFGIDVGYGQLHWKLQKDDRVISFDRENFRNFDLAKITDPIELIVTDVSFISVIKIFPKIMELYQKQDQPFTWIILVKPQFEAGPGKIEKGGIVKDSKVHQQVLSNVSQKLAEIGFQNIQSTPSPITGAQGNIEFLLCCHL